jgi:hypothetical protein
LQVLVSAVDGLFGDVGHRTAHCKLQGPAQCLEAEPWPWPQSRNIILLQLVGGAACLWRAREVSVESLCYGKVSKVISNGPHSGESFWRSWYSLSWSKYFPTFNLYQPCVTACMRSAGITSQQHTAKSLNLVVKAWLAAP